MANVLSYLFCIICFAYVLNAKPANDLKTTETCTDKFCPSGTYCESHVVKCKNPPCRPILLCLPENTNGCASTTCSKELECVERTIPCIGKICKKAARCVKPGTCDALSCPPSHRCMTDPNPHCVRGIFTMTEVAKLSQVPA